MSNIVTCWEMIEDYPYLVFAHNNVEQKILDFWFGFGFDKMLV